MEKLKSLRAALSSESFSEAYVSLGVAGLGLAGRIGIGRYSRVV